MVIPKPEAAIEPVDPGKSDKMLEELDQLAKLPPTKKTPTKQEKKAKLILEETFDEQDVIKQRKLPPTKKDIVPPVVINPLKQFEKLKKLEDLEDQPDPLKPVESPKKNDLFDELEFASLDRNHKLEERPKKSAADLLKELSTLDTVTPPKIDPLAPEKLFELEKTKDPKTFAPILDKLASLDVAPMEISIDVDTNRAIAKDFESGVWKVKVPDVVNPDTQESPSFVFSDLEGPPGADALSLYIGAIREKVYKKWFEPLAEKHNKEVLISFYLFPKGNIDKPILKRSSGVEQLDSLAIRAILDSEPFPRFPQELKFSNLNITINFKYVPEK
jgi:TonB family protein